MTSFRDKTITIKRKLWVLPLGSKPPPSAYEAKVKALPAIDLQATRVTTIVITAQYITRDSFPAFLLIFCKLVELHNYLEY